MKKQILLVSLVLLLALGGQAVAELATIDNVPAATLLVPYFEVDVSDDGCANPDRVTTFFAVNNASAEAAIAHVTIWTDWSVPALDFDIYLTGYDVQTVNLRDIFCNGNLPQTGVGSPGHNDGAFSIAPVDPSFGGSCNVSNVPGDGPFYVAPFSQALIDQLKTWFTGQPGSATQDCAGSDQGDEIARGYITIDSVQQCSVQFPTAAGYFVDIADTRNLLWGDYFYADPVNGFSQGFETVNIEADDTGQFFAAGDHTFYGRYVAADASDGREPLPTTMAARFAQAGGFDETRHLVWREGNADFGAVACGSEPSWFPLGFSNVPNAVLVFDEEENPFVPAPQTGPSNPLPPDQIDINLPNETNGLVVGNTAGGAQAPKLDDGGFVFGWVYYNLQSDATLSTYGDTAAQGWVSYTFRALNRFSVGLHGLQLDTAGNPIQSNPGLPLPAE